MKSHHLPVIALASTLMMTACSSFGPITSGTENPCATLQSIIEDYPNGFDAYRGSGSSYNMVTLYRAKEQLIKGHCEIWEWGNGDAAYTCTLGAPNQTVAEARFTDATRQLTSCLSAGWSSGLKSRERDGKPAGEALVLRTNDTSAPSVSLHRVQDGSRQSLYLFVGPAGRAPADN